MFISFPEQPCLASSNSTGLVAAQGNSQPAISLPAKEGHPTMVNKAARGGENRKAKGTSGPAEPSAKKPRPAARTMEREDAKGQFVRRRGDPHQKLDGLSSANPVAFSGDGDATQPIRSGETPDAIGDTDYMTEPERPTEEQRGTNRLLRRGLLIATVAIIGLGLVMTVIWLLTGPQQTG